MMNAPGIVRTHAQTTRPATPQRTAERRCVVPTPTIAPAIVCVVETGIPASVTPQIAVAAAASAAMPPTGWSFVIFEPIVCEAERGGREQLATSEPAVELLHLPVAMEQPVDAGHEREREEDPDDRRKHDEHEDLLVLGCDERSPACGRDRGASQTTDQRVG